MLRLMLGDAWKCLAMLVNAWQCWAMLGMESHTRDLGMNSHSFLLFWFFRLFSTFEKTTSVTTRVQNTTRYVIDGVSNHWNDPFYFHNNTKTTHTTRRRISTIAQKRFDPPRGSTNTYWIDGQLLQTSLRKQGAERRHDLQENICQL